MNSWESVRHHAAWNLRSYRCDILSQCTDIERRVSCSVSRIQNNRYSRRQIRQDAASWPISITRLILLVSVLLVKDETKGSAESSDKGVFDTFRKSREGKRGGRRCGEPNVAPCRYTLTGLMRIRWAFPRCAKLWATCDDPIDDRQLAPEPEKCCGQERGREEEEREREITSPVACRFSEHQAIINNARLALKMQQAWWTRRECSFHDPFSLGREVEKFSPPGKLSRAPEMRRVASLNYSSTCRG